MAERKRVRVPHLLLAPWVSEERGRMTRLVRATPVTWAAVNNVVWHGTVPGYRLARALSAATGFSVDEIIRASEDAAALRRELRDSEAA